MIFQDPMTSLNPVKRIGDQIGEELADVPWSVARRGTVRGRSSCWSWSASRRRERGRRLPARAVWRHAPAGDDRDGLAARSEPLIADEPTTALDVTIQRRSWRCCHDLTPRRST